MRCSAILCYTLISLTPFLTSAQARCPDENGAKLQTGSPTKIKFENHIRDQPIYIYTFDTDGRRRMAMLLQPNRQYEAETSEGAPWLVVIKRPATEKCAPISKASGGQTFIITEDILRDAISDYPTPLDGRPSAASDTNSFYRDYSKPVREPTPSTSYKEIDSDPKRSEPKFDCKASCREGRTSCQREALNWSNERRAIVQRNMSSMSDYYHSEMKEIRTEKEGNLNTCENSYQECVRDVCN